MERNETFDLCAVQYDRARPGYPDWIRDLINEYVSPGPGKKLIEIGCGTGKATELFASSGASIECVDIGTNLIAIAKKKFAAFPNVTFTHSHFEELARQPASCDLIFSAAAYHWIKQPAGNLKVRELLKKDGRFALIGHHHIGLDEGFFLESQPIYRSAGIERKTDGSNPLEKLRHIDPAYFKILCKKSAQWEKRCTADEYIDLLFTFSDHISMREECKDRFKKDIKELINSGYGGVVVKKYETRVEIGEKL